MKTLKQLISENGKFYWDSQYDEEQSRTLNSLIKYNDGVFKTPKQAWFLKRSYSNMSSFNPKFAGLKALKKDQYSTTTNGYMIFGKRGAGQGTRRVESFYVMDDYGVVEQYKLGFEYSHGGSASGVDPKKTKLQWKRPTKAKKQVEELKKIIDSENEIRTKEKKKQAKSLGKSKYIGKIKQRIKGVEVTVIRKNYFDSQWGRTAITVMQDKDGNMLQNFGKNPLEKGESATVDFTVKDHQVAEVNKWNKTAYKYTLVTRVSKKG